MPDSGADPIVPPLAARLDAFAVPALPADFTDRLVAAAMAGPDPLPNLRRPFARRWLRGGMTGLGAIAVGMISISAAAMGYFGSPIQNAVHSAPVIGTVIERVLPKAKRPAAKAAAPVHLARPAAPKIEVTAKAALVEDAQLAPPLTYEERRERRRAIMADPEARRAWIETHPVAAQRLARRREVMQRRMEIRRRRETAGCAPIPRSEFGPPPPTAQRMYIRRERMERLRERRRMLRQMRGEPEQAPE